MCECVRNNEQPYNCTKYSTKGHSTNKKDNRLASKSLPQSSRKKLTKANEKFDSWMQPNQPKTSLCTHRHAVWISQTRSHKSIKMFLRCSARSKPATHTALWMEALLPVPWILSRTSRTFQRPRRGWDRLGQFGTGFQRLPGQGAHTDLHPKGRRSLRAIVVTSDCALSSCWSLRHTGKPPRLFLGLFVFYAPDELCRWDAFGFLEFHRSQQTLQSSPGTEATQVLTLDPSHAPSVIFLWRFFAVWHVMMAKHQACAWEEAFSLTRLSRTLVELEDRLGRNFDVDQ